MMKNRLFAAVLPLLLMCALLPLQGDARAESADNVLRLHILANSDSEADQAVKLLVRDALIQTMPETSSAAEAEQFLLENGKAILHTAERVLLENGFPYGAQLQLGLVSFPTGTMAGKPIRRAHTARCASSSAAAPAITGGACCSPRCVSSQMTQSRCRTRMKSATNPRCCAGSGHGRSACHESKA